MTSACAHIRNRKVEMSFFQFCFHFSTIYIFFTYNSTFMPMPLASWPKAPVVLDRSNTKTVGSNQA
jgi:hypothetical protein